MKLIDFIRGQWVLSASGNFCERIINITKEMGIFISDIKLSEENTIRFSVSRKGAMMLFSSPLPPDITLSVIEQHGFPAIISNHKKRYALFIAPVVIFLLIFFSTHILWHVNIIDADPQTEEFLLSELEKLGVKKGRFTFLINQGEVKNKMLIKHEHLQWIWVDIKGGTALVRYSLRTPTPYIFDKNEPYNIVASHDATVTRIIASNGNAVVKAGDRVFKNQLLIEGVAVKDAEEKKLTHAKGNVFAKADFEKSTLVPKKKEIRTPTGNQTERLSVNFKNFNIKLFINSSILYPKYDIIEDNRSVGFLPLSFTKQTLKEVTVSYEDNDISAISSDFEKKFAEELERDGKKVTYIEAFTSEDGNEYKITARAICEFDIAEERRINIGENHTVPNN